jgi:hypothetical protein
MEEMRPRQTGPNCSPWRSDARPAGPSRVRCGQDVPGDVKNSLIYTCNAGFNLAKRVVPVGGWRLVQVACRGAVCQNFADDLSFTFTVRWRGGKARVFGNALTALASNKLLRLCSTLEVGDHICVDLVTFTLPHFLCIAHTLSCLLINWGSEAWEITLSSMYTASTRVHSFVPDSCKRTVIILPPRAIYTSTASLPDKILHHRCSCVSLVSLFG